MSSRAKTELLIDPVLFVHNHGIGRSEKFLLGIVGCTIGREEDGIADDPEIDRAEDCSGKNSGNKIQKTKPRFKKMNFRADVEPEFKMPIIILFLFPLVNTYNGEVDITTFLR